VGDPEKKAGVLARKNEMTSGNKTHSFCDTKISVQEKSEVTDH